MQTEFRSGITPSIPSWIFLEIPAGFSRYPKEFLLGCLKSLNSFRNFFNNISTKIPLHIFQVFILEALKRLVQVFLPIFRNRFLQAFLQKILQECYWKDSVDNSPGVCWIICNNWVLSKETWTSNKAKKVFEFYHQRNSFGNYVYRIQKFLRKLFNIPEL